MFSTETDMALPMDANQGWNKRMTDICDMYAVASFEDKWGAHLHNGFYDIGATNINQLTARIRMIEEVLQFPGWFRQGSLQKPKTILDVGSGLGGPTFHLAKKFGAKCIGINISPYQVQRATELSKAQGLADQVTFQVGDALQLPFLDSQFDLVFSMGCGEHLPDKAKFVSEMIRVAAPGGTIILTSICHRNLSSNETSFSPEEKDLLTRTCDNLMLSSWVSAADYVDLFKSHSVEDFKFADWSENVTPEWNEWDCGEAGSVLVDIAEANRKGLLTFNIFTCKKPE